MDKFSSNFEFITSKTQKLKILDPKIYTKRVVQRLFNKQLAIYAKKNNLKIKWLKPHKGDT